MWANAWLIWEKRDLLRSLPSISIPWCLRVWALLGGSKGIWGGSKGIWEVVVDASSCPQLDPAAFGSVCRHRAHPRMPPLPLGEAAGQRLPVIDVLWVITADNEIFNHHLYYGGSAEPGGKPLLFGQGCADGFGAILVLAEPGGPCVLANGLRLWWWQPLCVPELSLASAGHCWGSQQGREGTDPAGGHGLPLVPCPHCHQQCRASSVWHPGICLGPLWKAGGRIVGFFPFLCFPARAVAEAGGCWQLDIAPGCRDTGMQCHVHPQCSSTFLAPGARGFLQLHPFHGNREHFLVDLHASPHHAAFSHRYPSSCQFVSIYLPSSISYTLSRFLSSEFIHCWAQDKMNSHRRQASRSCCRKHPLLSPLLP